MAIGVGLVMVPFSSPFDPPPPSLNSGSLLPDPELLSQSASAPQNPASSVDLSAMSPREAADRLFNRVMAADENGNNAEALQFAPMALDAYGMVDAPDADAHYHMGLINLVLGDVGGVRAQIEQLAGVSANHLLGLSLAYELETRTGGDAAASDILARFAAAYDAEIARGGPEYEAHRVTIEKIHSLAMLQDMVGAANPLPAEFADGARLFDENCAQCHGPNGTGSDSGPPLVHKIYEPSHHADESFYRAVSQGVKSHHWPFGDMPARPGVTTDQVAQIVSYIRHLQEENGIR